MFPTIILNPVSGQGDRRRRLAYIKHAAGSLGWRGKIIETTPDALANIAVSNELKKGQKSFIVCGGDGTIMEAIGASVNKNVELGIVPLGTGNLLAKNLDLPLDTKDAMRVALQGRLHKLDIGQANEVFFAIMAGMGIDALIMRDTSRQLKNIFGLSAYYLTGITKLLQPQIRFEVSVNGVVQEFKAKTVLVANMGKFAGKLEAVPNALPNDGRLKVGVIKAGTLSELGDVVGALLRGNINRSKYYTLLDGDSILIKPVSGPQPFQCDGTHYPPTKSLQVTVYPQAITMRVP